MLKRIWLLCLLTFVPAGVAGQVQIHGIEVSGGYAGWGGKDFKPLEAGFRGQLGLLFSTDEPLSFGVTGTYGRGSAKTEDGAGDYNEWGAAATVRYSWATRRSMGPYVSALAGWTRLSFDLGQVDTEVETNGFAIGPGAGVEIPVGSVWLTLGGEVHWQSMGDFRLAGSRPGIGGGGAKGWRFAAEAGVIFDL